MATSTEPANNQPRPQSRSCPSRTRSYVRKAIVATCLVIAFARTTTSSAQANPTASRSFSLTPFALGSYIRPDYYQDPGTFGYGAGLDVGLPHMVGPFQPAAEVRITGVHDTFANEYSYQVGVKMTTLFHGIHPYATFLGGIGTLYINHPTFNTYHGFPYRHDSAFMVSFGGGAEFDITHAWQLRLDYSRQMSGQGDYYVAGSPDIHPDAISFGVNYRIEPRHSSRK